MHRFRDMTTYWSKIAEKPTPPSFGTFLWGDPLRFFRRLIPCQKLESVYISRSCFRSPRHNTGVWRTSRETDGHVAVAKTALALRRAGKNHYRTISELHVLTISLLQAKGYDISRRRHHHHHHLFDQKWTICETVRKANRHDIQAAGNCSSK